MNQGTVGGAGITAHIHQHVVPRWGGDTNFMPVVGHTKVIPQSLESAREALRQAWPTP
jgi:ATP adenylyltransferase